MFWLNKIINLAYVIFMVSILKIVVKAADHKHIHSKDFLFPRFHPAGTCHGIICKPLNLFSSLHSILFNVSLMGF